MAIAGEELLFAIIFRIRCLKDIAVNTPLFEHTGCAIFFPYRTHYVAEGMAKATAEGGAFICRKEDLVFGLEDKLESRPPEGFHRTVLIV